jgi:hypothetical protein
MGAQSQEKKIIFRQEVKNCKEKSRQDKKAFLCLQRDLWEVNVITREEVFLCN